MIFGIGNIHKYLERILFGVLEFNISYNSHEVQNKIYNCFAEAYISRKWYTKQIIDPNNIYKLYMKSFVMYNNSKIKDKIIYSSFYVKHIVNITF
jgi:hypothetical protein